MTLYPRGPQMTPGLPVYKPEQYTGLLGKKKTQGLLDHFAGGILNGYQIQPPLNPTQYGMQGQNMAQGPMLQPTNPSGVYDTQPNGNPPLGSDAGGDGQFNAMHMIQLNNAMNKARWGSQQRPDLANVFQSNDDGTFSMSNQYSSEGMPWTVPGGGWEDAGMSPDEAVDYWTRQLSYIDNSP